MVDVEQPMAARLFSSTSERAALMRELTMVASMEAARCQRCAPTSAMMIVTGKPIVPTLTVNRLRVTTAISALKATGASQGGVLVANGHATAMEGVRRWPAAQSPVNAS
jgi:hypothetical protein